MMLAILPEVILAGSQSPRVISSIFATTAQTKDREVEATSPTAAAAIDFTLLSYGTMILHRRRLQ